MKKKLKVRLIQADIKWENKTENLAKYTRQINPVATETHVVFLPEMFATGFSMNIEIAETMDGQVVTWMRKTASDKGIIVCGSVLIKEREKYFNRLIWALPNGEMAHYDKRHLFAFGGEDNVFDRGEKQLVVQVNGWKLCLTVCYDLRFPVWCRQQGDYYDALVVVANWPKKRSHAWRTLLQARAIENQCFVIGVNRIGRDGHHILHSGDSMVVDPLGKIVADLPKESEAVIHYTLDPTVVSETREHFPFLADADSFVLIDDNDKVKQRIGNRP